MKRELTILICCLLAGIVLADEPPTNRPSSWAQPIKMVGVPNLHQVSTNLYRSAQPTAEGMQNLKKKGIETVVNLRAFHSDRDEIGNTGFECLMNDTRFKGIPMIIETPKGNKPTGDKKNRFDQSNLEKLRSLVKQ